MSRCPSASAPWSCQKWYTANDAPTLPKYIPAYFSSSYRVSLLFKTFFGATFAAHPFQFQIYGFLLDVSGVAQSLFYVRDINALQAFHIPARTADKMRVLRVMFFTHHLLTHSP